MPLAFESLSHGTVAFGFFNIDSDMVLLEQYFFFADSFCEWVGELAGDIGRSEEFRPTRPVYAIRAREQIGDLMGAIHGVRFTGFIGAVYRRFPFPSDPAHFKQKPEGFRTRAEMEVLIERYGKRVAISFHWAQKSGVVTIGEYRFQPAVFGQLIQYVWRGGYPRWRDDVRPDYVLAMEEKLGVSRNPLFRELAL